MSASTLLFDLDGTLIDTIELILSSYRHTLETHRGAVPPDELWLEGLGTPISVQFRRFTASPAEIEAMVQTYRVHNRQHHDRLVRRYPGVDAAVRLLHDRGTRLGVVTSKMRESAIRGLEHCDLARYFDVLVCADDVARPKPDPEPVRMALDRLGAAAGETIFVGDSTHDMGAGRAAGVRVAAVLWGPFTKQALEPYTPDFWLSHPSELAALAPSPV